MTRLLLISGLLLGLFAGCADSDGAAPEAATVETTVGLPQPPHLDEATVDEVETIQARLPGGGETSIQGYICKWPESWCCDPVGETIPGKTVCISKVFCTGNPKSCQ